jgi:predicted Rossmann-fold nucleotide-binding protein
VDGYFEHLIRMVDHMVAEGFLKPPYRDMLLVDHDLDRLLAQCRDYRTPDYAWTEENPLP